MTVQELIAQLAEMPQHATITVRVDCPHGGNSMPATIHKVYECDPKWHDGKITSVIVCDPEKGVEFEVFDAEEDTEEEEEGDTDLDEVISPEPKWGQCGKCGTWCHFPCYTCFARRTEDGE